MFYYFQGHISAGCPEVVINLHDEMSHVGLEPDSLSYNTLISACIKTKKLDVTMPFNATEGHKHVFERPVLCLYIFLSLTRIGLVYLNYCF